MGPKPQTAVRACAIAIWCCASRGLYRRRSTLWELRGPGAFGEAVISSVSMGFIGLCGPALVSLVCIGLAGSHWFALVSLVSSLCIGFLGLIGLQWSRWFHWFACASLESLVCIRTIPSNIHSARIEHILLTGTFGRVNL